MESMAVVVKGPHLLAFRDRLMPERGSWLIDASIVEQGFVARYIIQDADGQPRLLDQLALPSIDQLRDFTAQLNVHGWTSVPASSLRSIRP